MKNALLIFTRDIRRIARNPVAVLVMAGVLVLPSLYAWYCVSANWDPYQNTARIRVAVVNEDTGAQSSVAGHVNAGAQMVDDLRANHQLGWEFTTRKQALDGVQDGTYFAAIVIPSQFSADLTSIFTDHKTHPQLEYYVNEKLNAAAAKIADTGASTVEQQIDDAFTAATGQHVTQLLHTLASHVEGQVDEAGGSLALEVEQASNTIGRLRTTLNNTGTSAQAALATADDAVRVLNDVQAQLPQVEAALDEATTALQAARTAAGTLSAATTQTAGETSASLGRAAAQASAQAGALAGDALQAQGQLDGMLTDAEGALQDSRALLDSLRALEPSYPELSPLIAQLELQINDQMSTLASLQQASQDARGIADATQAATQAIDEAVRTGTEAASQAQASMTADALPRLGSSLDSFALATSRMAGATAALKPALIHTRAVLEQLKTTLDQAACTSQSASEALGRTQTRLAETVRDLRALRDSAGIQHLSQLMRIQPADVGSFLSSPARLNTHVLYPVSTYGSGVAPFYTNVALWVGAFMLSVIVKQRVDPTGLPRFTPVQGFVGRGLLFVAAGVLQALVACGSDLLIGIQCEMPVAFVFAGVCASVVYVSLAYALTSALRHVGKALFIVVLIVQIPGSAGLYPIQMMPQALQAIHPLLPFTYSIGAMREAIAGAYDAHYALDLVHLALFLPLALIVGFAVRPLLANMNLLFDRRLARTDVLASEAEAEGVALTAGSAQAPGEVRVAGATQLAGATQPPGATSAAREAISAVTPRHRLREAILVLLDTPAFRTRLTGRIERFYRHFPTIRRTLSVLLVAAPLALLGITAALHPSTDAKLDVLFGLVALMTILGLVIVALEYLHESLQRRPLLGAAHNGKDTPV